MMSDDLISNLGNGSEDVDVAALDAAIDKATVDGDDQTARLLRKARDENARRRVATREAAERIKQLEADYQALSASSSTSGERLKALEAELTQERQARASDLEKLTAANKAAIDALPEKFRALVPDGLDAISVRAWLDRATPLLSNSPAPLEGQAGSMKGRDDSLVAVDEAAAMMAQALQIDPQALAKRVKDGNKRI
jgi:hypothetical protein